MRLFESEESRDELFKAVTPPLQTSSRYGNASRIEREDSRERYRVKRKRDRNRKIEGRKKK